MCGFPHSKQLASHPRGAGAWTRLWPALTATQASPGRALGSAMATSSCAGSVTQSAVAARCVRRCCDRLSARSCNTENKHGQGTAAS